MTHSHNHSGPAPASRKAVMMLATILAVLFIVTLAAVVIMWPSASELPEKRSQVAEGAQEVAATVVSIDDPGDIGSGKSAQVLAQLKDSGEQVIVSLSPAVITDDLVGATMRVIVIPGDPAIHTPTSYIFMDFQRGTPLLLIAALFAIAVIAVARLKGLAALIGLAGALAMIWFFTLPALLAGHSPVVVALATSSAILFIVLYLAHGISVKSSTALLGTFAGIALVILLASWAIPATHLIPGASEEMARLTYYAPDTPLRGILLCGMVLGGVGALNDVTITQASSVWELRAAAPNESRRQIFTRAMRIGRDHIASTVYTIAFAYVGSALGLLLLVSTLDQNLLSQVTYNEIAQELVAIAVASIGLVLTIPLTTLIAAVLAGGSTQKRH